MTPLQIASVVLILAAASGSFNYFVLKLPASIGIMVTALLGSIVILGVDHYHPSLHLRALWFLLLHLIGAMIRPETPHQREALAA